MTLLKFGTTSLGSMPLTWLIQYPIWLNTIGKQLH
jgi:hypothetical protein